MPPQVTYRITAGKKGMMLAIALLADGIQLIFKFLWFTGILAILGEMIGWAMSGLASLLLVLAFGSAHVNPMNGMGGKTRTLITVLCEGMPIINVMPTFTIWTILTIRQSRAEDQERAARSATIKLREEAIRRGGLRRMRRDGTQAPRPMRRMLRNIPHPVFRVASAARRVRPSEPSALKKNAL